MTKTLSDLFAENRTGAPHLIIDASDYGKHVLLQDRELPWHDATAFANHLSQIQSLLGSDVVLIRLDQFVYDSLRHATGLVARMGAKTRKGFAARTLLTDDEIKDTVYDAVTTAAKTQRKPLVLHLASPRDLLLTADLAVNPDSVHEFDDDDVENTAVYYSDWLRMFAGLELAGLVLDERSCAIPDESLQPVLNTVQHYRWDLARRTAAQLQLVGSDLAIPVLAQDFWIGTDAAPSGSALYAEIPADAVPEHVLDRLAELRSGGSPAATTGAALTVPEV